MATVESKQVSDVIMNFVDKGIKDKHQLGDLSKGDLVKMLYKITNDIGYWELIHKHKILED